jgi:hypothetical protein
MGSQEPLAGSFMFSPRQIQNHPWIMHRPSGSPSGSQIIAGLEPLSFEEVTLPSGQHLQIPKCVIVFKEWRGAPIKDTYNHKAVIDFEGKPLFAELAILRVLERSGWSGVWSDSYRNKYRVDLPEKSGSVNLPPAQERLIAAIKERTGRRGGCWDVFAWKNGRHIFAELKRSKKDKLRPNQFLWLQESLAIGVKPEEFLLVEWSLQ